MSDENFLARWSRRKREVAAETDAPVKPADAESTTRVAGRDDARPPAGDDVPQAPSASQPFDPASLPDLESITEATDVRSFLNPGVPPGLTREALRRAWSADPAIRDFVGLQEYDWDFNTPGAISGFAEIGSDYNVKDMVARVFGDAPEPESATAAADAAEDVVPSDQTGDQPIARADESKPDVAAEAPADAVRLSPPAGLDDPPSGTDDSALPVAAGEQPEELVRRNKEMALQHDDVLDDERQKSRRAHGGALPKS